MCVCVCALVHSTIDLADEDCSVTTTSCMSHWETDKWLCQKVGCYSVIKVTKVLLMVQIYNSI